MTSIAPTLDEYATKYEHVRLERDDGILQVTLHTGAPAYTRRRAPLRQRAPGPPGAEVTFEEFLNRFPSSCVEAWRGARLTRPASPEHEAATRRKFSQEHNRRKDGERSTNESPVDQERCEGHGLRPAADG